MSPRNPKAPLPPRVSLPDAAEAASAPASSGVIAPRAPALSPESMRAPASKPPPLPPARASQAPRPPLPSLREREGEGVALPNELQQALAHIQKRDAAGDPALALAQLQRQRELGAPAPPPPASRPALGGPETQRMGGADSPRGLASVAPTFRPAGAPAAHAPTLESPAAPIQPVVPSTTSITAPFSALNLKPAAASLSAGRMPTPMAIVGGSSLRPNVALPDRPMMPSRPPTHEAFVPPPAAMGYPAPAAPTTGLAPVPPAVPSSRPDTANKPWAPAQPQGGEPRAASAFPPPAGGPPASYERAFRQWSSPGIMTDDAPNAGGPVSFQVYTAQDISVGRGPVRSPPQVAPEPKKASLALRIGMVAIGSFIVLLTAAAVVAVSTEEPKRPPASASAAANATEVPSATAPPEPSTISIGDPVDDSAPAVEPPPEPAPAVRASAGGKPKPRASSSAAPSGLKAIAPPPNPYGN
ncbi:MAG: hypothetical protein KF894_08375 [Labilithrix sp.]|nr:hypothetical protein [Labilithrix sp.]